MNNEHIPLPRCPARAACSTPRDFGPSLLLWAPGRAGPSVPPEELQSEEVRTAPFLTSVISKKRNKKMPSCGSAPFFRGRLAALRAVLFISCLLNGLADTLVNGCGVYQPYKAGHFLSLFPSFLKLSVSLQRRPPHLERAKGVPVPASAPRCCMRPAGCAPGCGTYGRAPRVSVPGRTNSLYPRAAASQRCPSV